MCVEDEVSHGIGRLYQALNRLELDDTAGAKTSVEIAIADLVKARKEITRIKGHIHIADASL